MSSADIATPPQPHDRRTTPARGDLAAAHLRGRVEAERFADPVAMTVAAPLADMRPRPEPAARLDTQLLAGERVAAYEIGADWVWAQAETDGYVGYVPRAALAEPGARATHRVATRAAQIYAEPDIKAPVLARLPAPAGVAVAAKEDRFAVLAGGGYMPLAQLAALTAPAGDWVAEAAGYLGAPYLWGGRSADGLDCSALVQLSLAAAGHAAPRDSDMQEAALGRALPPEADLLRGDLVFWRGHVGVMEDAETLLHANAFHMSVAREPLKAAQIRILEAGDGEITALRRLGDIAKTPKHHSF
ncbi:MAG: NlpC/P60 family protein [Pseudomonadota bacterium]